MTWEKTQELRSGKYTLWDHCFEKPEANFEAKGLILASVAAGAETHKLTVSVNGDYATTVEDGAHLLTIKKGDQTTKLDLGTLTIDAMTAIVLKVGGNSIKIEQAGITIKGIKISAEGTATAEMKSPMTTVKGDGMLTLKGGAVMIN